MKKFTILTILMLSAGIVNAENLFSNSNPFPQNYPQTLNNIYEAEPAVIQKEEKQETKTWFKKRKKTQKVESSDYVVPQSKIINEGSNNGSFYVFK